MHHHRKWNCQIPQFQKLRKQSSRLRSCTRCVQGLAFPLVYPAREKDPRQGLRLPLSWPCHAPLPGPRPKVAETTPGVAVTRVLLSQGGGGGALLAEAEAEKCSCKGLGFHARPWSRPMPAARTPAAGLSHGSVCMGVLQCRKDRRGGLRRTLHALKGRGDAKASDATASKTYPLT